jgi:hypothetical protein
MFRPLTVLTHVSVLTVLSLNLAHADTRPGAQPGTLKKPRIALVPEASLEKLEVRASAVSRDSERKLFTGGGIPGSRTLPKLRSTSYSSGVQATDPREGTLIARPGRPAPCHLRLIGPESWKPAPTELLGGCAVTSGV